MVADHRYFAIWLGEKFDLNITFLKAGNTSA
jgi:aromatic ring-cleaving dioxygenase